MNWWEAFESMERPEHRQHKLENNPQKTNQLWKQLAKDGIAALTSSVLLTPAVVIIDR